MNGAAQLEPASGMDPLLISAPFGYGYLSPTGTLTSVNPQFCQIVDRAEHELVGIEFGELVHDDHLDLLDDIRFGLTGEEVRIKLVQPNGHSVRVDVMSWTVPGRTETAVAVRGLKARFDGSSPHLLIDDSEIRFGDALLESGEPQLRHLALHDSLTGLANRLLLADRVEQACARAARDGSTMALLVCDIDDFESVNRRFGPTNGDRLLVELSEQIKGLVRPSDTVARMGWDEFIVVCEGLADADQAVQMVDRISAAVNKPEQYRSDEIAITMSIGLITATGESASQQDAARLLMDAETALAQARVGGARSGYEVFSERLREYARERLQMESDLRVALVAEQFELHYQPVIDLRAARIMGFEALVRWNHPERGLLPPGDFLEVAEDVPHLVRQLGELVLEHACDEAARLREFDPDIWIAVNVSAHQLGEAQFCDQVTRALETRALHPSALRVELTESVLLESGGAAVKDLARTRDLGVRLAIDDFGTGYSSLAYLQTLPFDELKIDQAFVTDIDVNQSSAEIVSAIVRLGRALDATVIAEGVETQAQLETLLELGCDCGQGHLFGRAELAGDLHLDPALVEVLRSSHLSS